MDAILSSILGPLCDRVIDAAIDDYKLVRGVKEEIRNLRTTVSMIKGVLDDAEIATDEALRITRDAVTCSRLSMVRKHISCLRNVVHHSSNSSPAIAHRVKDINKKFEKISKSKDRLGLRVPDRTSWSEFNNRPPGTDSLLHPNEARIIGRDSEMKRIADLLLDYSAEGTEAAAAVTSDDKNNVRVISVVGMGGVGKTTLVKHAYKSLAVTEYFQLRMWVCVSKDFDLERITREITDAAASSEMTRDDQLSDNTSNWDAARKRLLDKLQGKRFLLVLDDVWEERPMKWDSLCTPLMYGGKGSKIIVSTRSRKVSDIIKGTPIFLKDLASKDLWTIFQMYAFDGHDPDKHTQLVLVGRQIVEKLKGSPLVAKTIGRLLNSNLDVKHWTNIMKSEAWVSPNSVESIIPILKLSYNQLSGHLKQCFAYCSLFPEDYHFRKDELVPLWMAQQFIPVRQGFFHEASVGEECVDDLVYMSLFEKYTYCEEEYVMHDLIHNLAELVSEGDCVRLEANEQKRIISETVRHVSIPNYCFDLLQIEQLCNYENMRTLLFLHGCEFQLDPHLGNIFTRLRRLRVLGLSGCRIDELPASIGALKHLRFLDLSHNGIKKLPESLCNKLHNLQVLNLFNCNSLSALPRNMSALINLRHLIVSNDELVSGIEGLGKLTALHELGGFDCSRQPMKELADMGLLRRLRIMSLEEVKSKEEAIQSRLDKKEHLDELTLGWRDGRDHDLLINNPGVEEEVLDGLQPHLSSIRRLSIKNYGGIRSPSWMEDRSWVRDPCPIERLELQDCTNWEVLPPLGQLLCLNSLKISGMRRVRRIGPEFMGCCCCCHAVQGPFPKLQVLEFEGMEEWEEWEAPHDGGEDDQLVLSEVQHQYHHPLYLTCLRELTIRNCPKLRQLPPLPPTLTSLRIENAGLSDLPGWSGCSSSSSLLSYLEIDHCPNLTSLGGGLLRHPLPKLVRLAIIDCQGLVSLPETGFGHLTSLKELSMADCPKLSWPSCESVEDTLPPSIERITIGKDAVEAATNRMMLAIASSQKLTCLKYLGIRWSCLSWAPRTPVGRLSSSSPEELATTLVEEFGRPPSSLEKLDFTWDDRLDDETLSALLRGLTSLRHLCIDECPAVTSLPRAEVLSHLTALEKLEIRRLKALKSFGGGGPLPPVPGDVDHRRLPGAPRHNNDSRRRFFFPILVGAVATSRRDGDGAARPET